MRSVADHLRRLNVVRVLEMPVSARIQLALSLGDDDLDLFVRSSGIERAEAIRRLRFRRGRGRTPSLAAGIDPR